MTTLEIEGYANEEGLVIGSADMNLLVRLRRKVIPKFYTDVGECAWRRKNATIAIVAGTRDYDLPANFGKMLETPLTADADGDKRSLAYIGENVEAMSLATADTDQGAPTGYWFVRVAGPPTLLRAIRLNKIPDQSLTLYYSYLSLLQFSDNTTSVELDNYIPPQFQWALVDALKKEIYLGRIPVGDQRLTTAIADYESVVMDAQDHRELGMRVSHKRIKTGPL